MTIRRAHRPRFSRCAPGDGLTYRPSWRKRAVDPAPRRSVAPVIVDQRQLLAPRERFDPRLLAARRSSVGELAHKRDFDREPARGVLARAPRAVLAKAPCRVRAPAGVQRPVGAAENVYPGVRDRNRYGA